MTLLESPALWAPLAAVAVQAVISWWRVTDFGRRIELLEKCMTESREWRAKHGQRIEDIANDLAEIRRKVWNGNYKP